MAASKKRLWQNRESSSANGPFVWSRSKILHPSWVPVPDRAKGCVNNARLSTFIREIWRENFVNETRTNKRSAIAEKGLRSRCGVKVPFANSLVACFHNYNNNINDFIFIDVSAKIPVACCRTSDLLIRYSDIIWGDLLGILSTESEYRRIGKLKNR